METVIDKGEEYGAQLRKAEERREGFAAAVRAGKRVRVFCGEGTPEDPVLIVYAQDGMAMSEAVAGWSAGVVEPVCALESEFLVGYFHDRARVEVAELSKAGRADRIDGQRTVRLEPDEANPAREFAIVKTGRRWTRVHEYLGNGQLTARAFVDEETGEVRQAAGARQAGRMIGAAGAEFYRGLLELPDLEGVT